MRRSRFLIAVLVLLAATGLTAAPPGIGAAPSDADLAPKLHRWTINAGRTAFSSAGAATKVQGITRSGEVAAGDVDNDGTDDLVFAAFSANTVLVREAVGGDRSFTPFPGEAPQRMTVAVGNLDGDSEAEIVVGAVLGGATARSVFRSFQPDGTALAAAVTAYEADFAGGTRVAVADVDGNGTNEIVTSPGPGRAPTAKAFTPAGTQVGSSTDAFASGFRGGVYVAAANLDGDAVHEVVFGAGPGGGPHVRVLEGLGQQSAAFFAFDASILSGVRVAAGVLGGAPGIVASVRDDTARSFRAFDPAGTALTAPTVVPGADGDLSLALNEGEVSMVDSAPRVITVDPPFVDHTRPTVRVYGVGLPDYGIDDIDFESDDSIFVVDFERVDGNDLVLDLVVAAGATPTGARRLTLANQTPAEGEASAPLHTTFTLDARSKPLRSMITTGVVGQGGPHVRTFTEDGPVGGGFFSGAAESGTGVRVARGDLNGNGIDEIVTAGGPGQASDVRVHDQSGALVRAFNAYGPFAGGVFVAVGEVRPDVPGNEIVTGADQGAGAHVRVFSSTGAPLHDLFPYGPAFLGGVRVAIGDIDGDWVGEILTAPGPGGGPHVRALRANGAEVVSFMAYTPAFGGGVYLAAADLNGDGIDEMVTGPGAGGGPHVRIFLGDTTPVGGGFFAFDPQFGGGVSVARIGDELIGPNLIAVGAGPGGGPHVRIVNAQGAESDGFFAYAPGYTGGVFVAGGLAAP